MAKKQNKSTLKDKIKSPAAEPSKAARALVVDRYKSSKNYRETEQEEIWERSYKNWRGELEASQYPWRSKLFIPWSFTVVETIIPKVFARDPKWRAVSRKPEGIEPQNEMDMGNGIIQSTPDQASVVNNLLAYQWSRMGMRIKMYDAIKDSLMYSKAFFKVTWNFQTKTKTVEEPVVGEDDVITFEKRTKSEVEYDDPVVDVVDPFDIYVDADATSLKDAVFLIHRKTVPYEKLKENPNYQNVDKIKFDDTPGGQSTNPVHTEIDSETRYNGNVPPPDTHKKLVEILEYWESDRLIVVANQSVVLRDTPNPYAHKKIPFVELDDYRDPHKFYGQSELSVIDPLQREVNSIRNQRRDYDNLALNPVIRMVPGVLRNPNSAVMSPGNVWMVSDLNSMDVFQLPQLQGSAVQVEQQIAQDIQRAVAVDEIGIGLMPDNAQRVAATTIVSSQSNAGKRFAVKIALLEEAVKELGQMVFALNQQFLDKERVIQIVGERGATEWVQLSPEDIRGDYFIDIETGSMLPKDEVAARQEAVQLLQYITPIIAPIIQSNPAVIMPVLRMILDTYELPGKQDVMDELNKALGVAKQVQEQQQQAAQAVQQAQAINQTQQALSQPAEQAPAPPQDMQGARADQELMAMLQGNQ